MSDAPSQVQERKRHFRACMFCGGRTSVLIPPVDRYDDELNADAEFASAGRSFSDVEDGDPIGVGCYRCSRKQWRREETTG